MSTYMLPLSVQCPRPRPSSNPRSIRTETHTPNPNVTKDRDGPLSTLPPWIPPPPARSVSGAMLRTPLRFHKLSYGPVDVACIGVADPDDGKLQNGSQTVEQIQKTLYFITVPRDVDGAETAWNL